jgi:putative ABC transport system permease protein
MHAIFDDLRYASRQLLKSPGFAVTAVLTLALGIGANTAIFTVVNAALLRALPLQEPERLVHLSEIRTAGTFQKMEFSYPDFVDFRDHNQSFTAVGGYFPVNATYTGREGSERVVATVASANFFEVLGVQPILGRVFAANADQAGGERTVLLTYAGWQTRFGGDPNVLGKSVTLNDDPRTIIGVLPANFQFGPSRSGDFWIPLAVRGWRLRRNAHWILGVGRLKSGVTLQQAQAEASGLALQLAAQYPESNPDVGIQMTPLREQTVGEVRPILLVLMGAVVAVLLITCSNLAGLQLARAVTRQKEIAVRTALGASRARIVRLLLTDSILISLLGGLGGVLLAYFVLPLLAASLPKDQQAMLPFLHGLKLDWSVLGFSAAVSIFAGLLFGLAPSLQGARSDVHDALQDGSRTTAGSSRHRLRDGLVVAQVAMAVVLLVSAGLVIKSLTKLLRVDPGFTVARLLTFDTSLPSERYPDKARQIEFERNLRARLEALPGVTSAATVDTLPLGNAGGTSRFVIAGHARVAAEEYEANSRGISPNYFETMGIPLRRGRFFNDHDDASKPRVIIINQTLADLAFPGQDPIGKHIDFTYAKDLNIQEIVGVVADENLGQLDHKPTPVIYDPYAQDTSPYFGVTIRTEGDPAAVAGGIRAAVREMDPSLPLDSVVTMERIIADSPAVSVRRYPAYVIGAFAALALVLAMLGIYGLLAYVVAQRTRELGIRLALGAQRRNLLGLVVGSGLRLALLGAAIGTMCAFAAGRMLATLLFEVRPADLAISLSVATLLVAVALLASYLPARRAASIEPMQALRAE